MIDIHSHILPSIDDGPETEEETFKIMDAYEEHGFEKVIPTPHFYPSLYEKRNEQIE